MTPIIIGYTVESWNPETIHKHVQEPQVPRNYKDEDKIKDWKAKNVAPFKEKWAKTSPWLKATGKIASIYAIDLAISRVFDSTIGGYTGSGALCPAARFYHWLQTEPGREKWFHRHPFSARSPFDAPVCFYGFRPKPFFRIAGLNCIRDEQKVPLGFWYQNEWCLDPKEMLLETEVKDKIPLEKLLEEAPGGPIELPGLCQESHQNARMDAILALELGVRYQLIPEWRDVELRRLIDDGIITQLSQEEDDPDDPEDKDDEEPVVEAKPKPSAKKKRKKAEAT